MWRGRKSLQNGRFGVVGFPQAEALMPHETRCYHRRSRTLAEATKARWSKLKS
jgi:hypothetical protein